MARVLVVDDDPALLDILAESFALEGFEVCAAPDLATALDLLQRPAVDLILTDLLSTPFSSTPFAPLAALAAAAPATPIVLVTGYTELLDLTPADYGLTAILGKPFEMEALLSAVQAALAAHQRPLHPDGITVPSPAAPGGAANEERDLPGAGRITPLVSLLND
jgi:DNA-binding response OmpR family regulator